MRVLLLMSGLAAASTAGKEENTSEPETVRHSPSKDDSSAELSRAETAEPVEDPLASMISGVKHGYYLSSLFQ